MRQIPDCRKLRFRVLQFACGCDEIELGWKTGRWDVLLGWKYDFNERKKFKLKRQE